MGRKMKDSGIEWIGEIPEDWEIIKNKYVMRKEKLICDSYNNEDIISLTMAGVIVRDLDAGGKMPSTFVGYQFVEPDDLLLCLFDIDVTPRCVGLVKNMGLTSPAYSRFKIYKNYYSAYYDYLLRFIDDNKAFLHLSKNLRNSLTEGDFGAIKTIAPPYKMQVNIASYLDEKCTYIDSTIKKTQESIEEYKKLKQAIITKAVTKGLRGDRPMKDSGVEWIGQIPTEWEVKRTKYIAKSMTKGNGITKNDVVADGDIQCIRYGEIYSKYEEAFVETFSRTNENSISSARHISKGDILFTCTGELIDEIGKNVVYMGDKPCLVGGDIIVMKHEQNPIFLNYALNSSYSQAQKSFGKTKLKVVHISAGEIGNILIALPPINEQIEIANYLDKKSVIINQIIEAKEKSLEEFKSYKKSLIYEYVTGKKEVPQND